MAHEIGRRGLLAGGLAVGLAVAGCGHRTAVDAPGQGGPPIEGPSDADARRALRAWAAFPVAAASRPLVLIDGPVLDPAQGFPDGASKLAYAAGAFDLPATFPTGPARAGGLPLLGAQQAAAALSGQGTRESTPSRLAVTGIRFGSAEFRTDRGSRQLPAWLFSLRGIRSPAGVLAVAPAARFSPELPAPRTVRNPILGTVSLSPDGHAVTMSFAGSGIGSGCGADYILRVVESRQAVALRVGWVKPAEDTAAEACDDGSYHRSATAPLATPLGARVLVSAEDARPLEVAAGA